MHDMYCEAKMSSNIRIAICVSSAESCMDFFVEPYFVRVYNVLYNDSKATQIILYGATKYKSLFITGSCNNVHTFCALNRTEEQPTATNNKTVIKTNLLMR